MRLRALTIGAKERVATGALLAIIAAIALAVGWTSARVREARLDQQQAAEIARTLTHLRLVTFEFALHRHERARAQWNQVSGRLDGLLAGSSFPGDDAAALVQRMRERRTQAQALFDELAGSFAEPHADPQRRALNAAFEAQVLNRLVVDQQDNLAAAFELADVERDRVIAAQYALSAAIFLGLALIAAIKVAVSWLIHRNVLAPIARLQSAARRVAAGDRDVQFAARGHDEVGELARDLAAMTRSLRESLAQLGAANKELEAFAYSVSHDLRAPLRAIDGFSQALLEDSADRLDDDGKDSLRRVRAAAQRMADLIDDMLKLSRATRGEVEIGTVDLSALAESTLADLRQAEPGRKAETSVAPGVIARGDARLLGAVLENLLSNAWKFTGKTAGARIEFGAEKKDGELVCRVRDNGAGFDMAYAGNLFAPFQRLHQASEFPGNGIGLATVKRIIARLGGRVWAEGAVGKGATFYFSLPDAAT